MHQLSPSIAFATSFSAINSSLRRDEMRLAGYTDDTPEIDVCAGID